MLDDNFIYNTLAFFYFFLLILSILVLKLFYSKKEKNAMNRIIDNNGANIGEAINIQIHGSMPKPAEMAKIISSSNNAIKYLIQQGVLQVPFQCECGGNLFLKKRNGRPNTFYRCTKKGCSKGISILKNTFYFWIH